MKIHKHAASVLIFLMAAAGAETLLSAPVPSPSNPSAQAAGGYPPTVDMRQFQLAFN